MDAKKYYSLESKNDVADLYIFGDITSWPWLESDVSASGIVNELQSLDAKEINVHINSYGGEVAEGLAIYNTLKNSDMKVTTICDGFACSAASVIFMAGDERIINEASLLMIHNAWTYANGNATELRKAAEDLDKITQASVNAYVSRATISEDEIKNLMDNETWITAQEAVEYGFATKTEKSDDGGIKQSAFANIRSAILEKTANVKPVEIAMQLDDEAIAEVIAERVVNLIQKKEVPAEPKEPANSTGWSAFFEYKGKDKMKIENLSQELKEKVKQLLESAPADQKADAIMQSIEMIEEAAHADLINQVVAEAERASHDAEFKKQLGLRNLSQEEKKFYEGFKDIKQSVTANQIDIIPTEIIDRTLDNVRKASPILKLVNMAPANVKKWIVASHSGAAVWGDLTDEIKGELSGTISALNIELHMLSAYLVIPKAIRELSMEFVDRYFMAILSEAMQDGLVKGYLDGDGKTGPIGIFRQIGTTNDDGTNKAKTVLNNITKFSPKGLASARKTLTNDGLRAVDKIYLICNPSDEAEYVDPCMYGEAMTGGYVNKSFVDIEKIVDANCPKGKAAFTISGYYTMGTTGVRVTEYDQTKAMENADLIIANCYANGRAVDDNVAVIFDVTKLEEYVINVHQTSTASV